MAEPLTDQVMSGITQASKNYYRLLVVVAPSGRGKTAALQVVQGRTGAPLINLNLELSRRMLDLTGRQRATSLPRLMGEVLEVIESEVVLFDNVEILFDVSLRQDPLRLLQNLSRNKTIVVAWSGFAKDGKIDYATPDHQEYRQYPIRDFLVVGPETTE